MESQRSFLVIGLVLVSFLLYQQWLVDYSPNPQVAPAQTEQHLLLVIDQFEELYTLAGRSDTEANIFVANLLEAANDSEGRIAIIIMLRSDFFDELTHRHKALASICAKQKSLVGPPTEQGLRQAIAVPASRAGHPLNEIIVDQLVTQALGRDGALPLLQVALGAIWNGIKQGVKPEETLHKLGGVFDFYLNFARCPFTGVIT